MVELGASLTVSCGRYLILQRQDQLGLSGQVLAAPFLVLQYGSDAPGQSVQTADHRGVSIGLQEVVPPI